MPFKATQLYALAIPDTGGDTLFASGYAAYDALPQRLKHRLGRRDRRLQLRRPSQGAGAAEPRGPRPFAGGGIPSPAPTAKPAASRFTSIPAKILYIQGAGQEESDALIDELTALMIQPQGEYRHKWHVGDVVIWDNRCSYHKAAGDYPPEQDRIHWRTSIKEPVA